MKILLDTNNSNLMLNYPDTMSSIKLSDGELNLLLNNIEMITKRKVNQFKKGKNKNLSEIGDNSEVEK